MKKIRKLQYSYSEYRDVDLHGYRGYNENGQKDGIWIYYDEKGRI